MAGTVPGAGEERRVALFSGPCDRASPAEVRRRLAAPAPRPVPAALVPDCQLIASELVANALNAGADWIDALLVVAQGHLELSVRDDAPGVPATQHPAASSVTGRGLTIVEAIAHQWGYRPDRDGGKTVWARLSLPGRTEAAD